MSAQASAEVAEFWYIEGPYQQSTVQEAVEFFTRGFGKEGAVVAGRLVA